MQKELAMNFKQKWIIYIEFGFSRSANYKKAIGLARDLPNFIINDNVVTCGTTDIMEYVKSSLEFKDLIFMVKNWKNATVKLYGKPFKTMFDYWDFYFRTVNESKEYRILLTKDRGTVTYEKLPLPIVYYPELYGAFFAFSEDVNTEICFCKCERMAIENYVKLRKQQPLKRYSGSKTNPLGTDCFPMFISEMSLKNAHSPLSMFKFKKNICFYCNNKIPKLKFCVPMYGNAFKQTYGWLIRQEYFRLGIDPYQHDNILPGFFPNDIDIDLDRYVENSARQRLGFKKVGEAWTSETTLYYIVKGLYPTNKVIMHYHPEWLHGLELDIFIQDLNIAFEYQGIQHFKPVEHWGGMEQLLKQQENDELKLQICKKNECYFNLCKL